MKYYLPLLSLLLLTPPGSFSETIYRCDLADGTVSLQRQRCSVAAEQQRYSFPDKIRSDDSRGPSKLPESTNTKPQSRRPTTRRSTAKPRRNPVGKQLTQCRKLWNREEDLRDNEREGYTAAEGEEIRREQRRIKRNKAQLHCDELD